MFTEEVSAPPGYQSCLEEVWCQSEWRRELWHFLRHPITWSWWETVEKYFKKFKNYFSGWTWHWSCSVQIIHSPDQRRRKKVSSLLWLQEQRSWLLLWARFQECFKFRVNHSIFSRSRGQNIRSAQNEGKSGQIVQVKILTKLLLFLLKKLFQHSHKILNIYVL